MKHPIEFWPVIVISPLFLIACETSIISSEALPTPGPSAISLAFSATNTPAIASSPTATLTATSTPKPTTTPTSTPDVRPDPNTWADWPVIPTLSARSKEIFQSRSAAITYKFSTVGDCQSEPAVFMGIYTMDWYNPRVLLADQPELWQTIELFRDSFQHDSLAVRDGLSAPSALDPLWADPDSCEAGESPLECELRMYQPIFVFVNLGTVWRADASTAKYEEYLRQIIEIVISHGAIPILSTKADNVERDWSINKRTVRVAYDYDIPLVNFWRAARSLPDHGLDPERGNLYMTTQAWDLRNYIALKTLDGLWRSLGTPPD